MIKLLSVWTLNLSIGFLFFLVAAFLQSRNSNVSFVKDLKLEVKNKIENNEYFLDKLVFNIRGLKIGLSKFNPLIIVETGLHLFPISYKVQNMAICVYFENDIFLKFSFDSENNFNILSNISKTFLLSFEVSENYKIVFEKYISIIGENLEFKVFLGKNVKMSKKDILIPPKGIFQISNSLKYVTDTSKESDISEQPVKYDQIFDLLTDLDVYSEIKAVNSNVFNETLENFRKNAYITWSKNLSVVKGGWLKKGIYTFDENILVCFLAESLARRDLALFLKLKPLIVENQQNLTYLSLNYYANSDQIDKFIAYLRRNKIFIDTLELNKFLEYLKSDPNFLEKIFLSENISYLNYALSILKSPIKVLSSNFSLKQAYNILFNYLTFLRIDTDDFIHLKFKQELIKFVAKFFGVKKSEKVFHLKNDINSSHGIEYLLKISGLLKKIAEYLKDDLILKLAINSIYYALIDHSVKGIPHENYYFDIIDNNYVPKFAFFSNFKTCRWIYASFKILRHNFNDDKISIDFDQEIDSFSYLFLNTNLNPTLVRFREIDWFTDPQFYIYSDGWKYYPSDKILALKITPKKKGDLNIMLKFDQIQ